MGYPSNLICLYLARESGDDSNIAQSTYNLAVILLDQGHLEEIRPLLEESLTLKQLIGDRADVVSNLAMLGRLEIHQGDSEQAAVYLQKALTLSQQVEDPYCMIDVLWIYGLFYEQQEVWPEALAYYQQQLELGQDSQDPFFLMHTPFNLARIYLHIHSTEQACLSLIEGIERILETGSSTYYDRHALLGLSDYFQATADYHQSANFYFAYLQTGINDPDLTIALNRVQAALQANLTAAEWDALSKQEPNPNLRPTFENCLIILRQATS